MGDKPTPFQEGMEHVRSDLWLDLPDGYKRGTIAGTGFVHVPAPTCEVCGAVVADIDVHDEWHRSLGRVAATADRASVFTDVIGPKATLPPEVIPTASAFGEMRRPYQRPKKTARPAAAPVASQGTETP